jgi:hypothetical protein
LSEEQPEISGNGDRKPRLSGLDRDVRKARLAQAAHFDALVEIRDAQTLRLVALKDALENEMREEPRLKALLPLQLAGEFPPRLWLDNITYVEMQPDPRTFRLVRQQENRHVTVHETRDLANMTRAIKNYASHRLVERELFDPSEENGKSRSVSQLLMSWLTGFTIGIMVMLMAGLLTGRLAP